MNDSRHPTSAGLRLDSLPLDRQNRPPRPHAQHPSLRPRDLGTMPGATGTQKRAPDACACTRVMCACVQMSGYEEIYVHIYMCVYIYIDINTYAHMNIHMNKS